MSAVLHDRPVRNDRQPLLSPDRARALLFVAFRPAGIVLVFVAALTLVTLVTANSELTGTAGAIAASWLAVNQVPITIGATTLGILPLAPTIGLVLLVAREVRKAVRPLTERRDIGTVVGAAVAGPFTVTVVALGVVKDASGVIALVPPDTLVAFAWVIVVQLVGAGIGVLGAHWRRIAAELPNWLAAGAVSAIRAVRRLLLASLAVTVVSILASWSVFTQLFHTDDGTVGFIGLTVLSLAYLPNVVVGTTAVVSGASVHVGAASVDVFAVVGGPVPGLPVLAAIPTGAPSIWWPALLVIPAVVAVQFGRDCATACNGRADAARAAGAGAVIGGLVFVVVGLMAGGDLGTFGHIGVDLVLFVGATVVWLGLFGAATALIVGKAGVAPAQTQPERRRPVEVPAELLARIAPAPVAVEAEIVETHAALDAAQDPDIIDAEVVAEAPEDTR